MASNSAPTRRLAAPNHRSDQSANGPSNIEACSRNELASAEAMKTTVCATSPKGG